MKKAKILIVEDEAILAKNLQDILNGMGYDVVGVADNAMKSIMLFFLNEPDLILMDIHLKGDLDGIKAAEKIQEQKAVPIVFLTANQDPATFEKAKINGAMGYILKPFQERELQIVIEIALVQFEERKKIAKLETLLLNSERMNLIDTFASGIVHNINSSLTPIYLAMDILKKEESNNPNPAIKAAIDLLDKNNNKINVTIKNYKNLLEKRPFEEPIMINLKKICKEALNICKYYTLEKKIIIKELLGNENTKIYIGYNNFFQILVNLIKNTCEAMENSKEAWLQFSWEEKENDIICLKLTDSGNGIAKDIEDKIFDPFFTTKLNAAGLGLSFCKNVLQKYNSSIKIDSENKNTCFIIELNNKEKN